MTLDESTGVALKTAVAARPDWLLCRCETSRLLPVWVARAPRGWRLGELFQRCEVLSHIVPDLPVSRICIGFCWSLSFWRHVLAALQ